MFSRRSDDLNAARGCINGVMLGSLCWVLIGALFMWACEADAQTFLSDSDYRWSCAPTEIGSWEVPRCNPGSLASRSFGDLEPAEWQTYYAGTTPLVTCGEYLDGVEYRAHVGPVLGPDDGFLDYGSAMDAGVHSVDLVGPAFSFPPEEVAWVHRHGDASDIVLPPRLLHPLEELFDDHSEDYNSIPQVSGSFHPEGTPRFATPLGYGDSNGYYLRRSHWHGPISCIVEQENVGITVIAADMGAHLYNVGQFRLTAWGDGQWTEKLLPPGTSSNQLTLTVDEHAVEAFTVDAKKDAMPYVLIDVGVVPLPEPGVAGLVAGVGLLWRLRRG
jgi:hypothetical protein